MSPAGRDSERAGTSRWTRRRFLTTSGAGLAGVGLGGGLNVGNPAATAAESASRTVGTAARFPGFGRAKSVVILYLYGAPGQVETLDPKPDAPLEIRGEVNSIPSCLPGVRVSELLPRIGKELHRTALIRSMSHTSNNHAVSVALSGLSKSTPRLEGSPQDPKHQPYVGSVLEYLWKLEGLDAASTGVPVHVMLPHKFRQKFEPNGWTPDANWLGRGYNPVIPRFVGDGSLKVGLPTAGGGRLSRYNPFHGCTPESEFVFEGTTLPKNVSTDRLNARRRLLEKLDESGDEFLGRDAADVDRYRSLAYSMIADPKVAQALQITRESRKVREEYGFTLFGQSTLAARRLIEAGVKIVTCLWDDWEYTNSAWDTHSNHFPRLKRGLCPILDQLLPTFLDDMDQRGLLDDTLVMVISEHGRTPRISKGVGGGREHWSGVYWNLFFGAGIDTGQVIGASDRLGAYPITSPIDPNDILATMYHLLGVDPGATTIPNRLGQPTHILPHGNVVGELLA